MTDPIISPAYNDIRESDVVQALEQASLRELARALDPGAFRGDHKDDGFRCPDCGFWNAVVLDEFRWTCPWCPGVDRTTTTSSQRTKIALRARVADNYEACLRLVVDVIDPRTMPNVKKTDPRTAGRKPTGHGGKVLT